MITCKLHDLCSYSMENQLADFERHYQVPCWWKVDSKEFIDARQSFLLEKRNQLYSSLWSARYSGYLLKMIAKYAGSLCINVHDMGCL